MWVVVIFWIALVAPGNDLRVFIDNVGNAEVIQEVFRVQICVPGGFWQDNVVVGS